ncbi:unnamed protein product [Pleuronectes platessa]|uniref:Uncharacterized protein n=1 Tax=Pleuronectes platessa TaxID=8262 RepID=A0A9N7TIN1_PLEPL|nr:unnamed protein product [Pleuronectes platessa]
MASTQPYGDVKVTELRFSAGQYKQAPPCTQPGTHHPNPRLIGERSKTEELQESARALRHRSRKTAGGCVIGKKRYPLDTLSSAPTWPHKLLMLERTSTSSPHHYPVDPAASVCPSSTNTQRGRCVSFTTRARE